LAVLLVLGAVGVAEARQLTDDGPQPALPAADAPLPATPGALAVELTATTRALRAAEQRWAPAAAVPRDVTYLALHHQRILRRVAERRQLGDATHEAGQRRFGVHWSVLAAVNFVESAFGRVRSASEAGARGPMQFLPAAWRAYGLGGDIDDPRDAILAAASYLSRSGASRNLDQALFAYNHSSAYVRAIRRFAARMRADERTFLTYYAWQVYVRTPTGSRRITGPGV
jgi:membrane-bound lytic murein transglycosylase B